MFSLILSVMTRQIMNCCKSFVGGALLNLFVCFSGREVASLTKNLADWHQPTQKKIRANLEPADRPLLYCLPVLHGYGFLFANDIHGLLSLFTLAPLPNISRLEDKHFGREVETSHDSGYGLPLV